MARSFAEEARLKGKDLLICYSKTDHPAVSSLEENYLGPHVKFFELTRDGEFSYAHEANYRAILDKKENNPELMILVHHLWVHNETGHVAPLGELARLQSIPDLFVHVDAVQAPGKVVDWRVLSGGDLWTFSAHKFGALKGIGFTLVKSSVPFHPLLTGGGQQGSFRSGTENPMGAQSVALALKDLSTVDVKALLGLRAELVTFLAQELRGVGELITGPAEKMNANTVYFYLHRQSSDISLALFDLNGVLISAGSACQSGASKASSVLLHLQKGNSAKNGLRLSFGFQFDQRELNNLRARLAPIFNKLRSL